MSNTQKNKIFVAAAAAVLIAVVIVWKWPHASSNKTETTEASNKLSAFIDWNITPSGPLADEARTLMTERLIDVGQDGRIIYRLAGVIEPDIKEASSSAKIAVKDNVYWSDQVQLTAQQVVDAWNRYKETVRTNPSLADTDGTMLWIRSISIKAVDKLKFEIAGFKDQEELTTILRSRYLIPVRLDLINVENGSESAWLTTIGRYRLQKLPPDVVTASAELEFVPNASYYRGAARETVKVAVGKMSQTSSGADEPASKK